MHIQIPANTAGITLGQYVDYNLATSDIERMVVITGKSRKTIEGLKADTVREILESYEVSCVTGAPKHEQTFLIGAVRYGFIPDINAMTFGEHVDLDAYSRKAYSDGQVDYKSLVGLIAIMFRPVTEQLGKYYNIEPYDSVACKKRLDDIRQITLDRVNGALVFFSTIVSELTANSTEYLEEVMKETMKTVLKPQAD
jgi:hypothetical protein